MTDNSNFDSAGKQQLLKDIFGNTDDELSDVEDLGDSYSDSEDHRHQQQQSFVPNDELIEDALPPPSREKGKKSKFKKTQETIADNNTSAKKTLKPKKSKAPSLLEKDSAVKEVTDPLVTEVRRQFDEILQSKAKKRKRDLSDDVELDKRVTNFIERMREAGEQDIELHNQGQASSKKLQMLPIVISQLSKQDLHEVLLDNRILDVIKFWLEPFSDGTLQSIDLRKSFFECLYLLDIDKIHLKESGIGKIVLFLHKHPQETRENKKLTEKLINKWSRPLLGHSQDYRDFLRFSSFDASQQASNPGSSLLKTNDHRRGGILIPPPNRISPASINAKRDSLYKTNNKYKSLQNQMERLKRMT